jgi:hypothetical protein
VILINIKDAIGIFITIIASAVAIVSLYIYIHIQGVSLKHETLPNLIKENTPNWKGERKE